MPSVPHEALILLFRNRPLLAAELAEAVGVRLPPFAQLRVESSELGEAAPTEYRADLVIVMSDDEGEPALATVVEVQLQADEDKRFTWPAYETTARARFRCPAIVLVVAASDEVARWAKRGIRIGPSGSVMRPIVIGRAAVPIVTTPEQASSSPELAVLSAIAHGEEDPETAVSVARAAFEAIVRLDGERATLYYDLIRSRVGEAARRALEELMQSGKYEYQSDFARKYYGEGRAEGRAEGEAIGRAEGRAEGEAIGRAEAVLNVLAARGIAVKPAVRSRVLSCGDIATLDAWLRRAVTVAAAEDIFES